MKVLKKKIYNYFFERSNALLLELFFDLIIVVALGGITHQLIDVFSQKTINIWEIFFLFFETLTILLIWKTTMWHSSRINQFGFVQKIYIFFLMVGFMFIIVDLYLNLEVISKGRTFFWFYLIGYILIFTSMLVMALIMYLKTKHIYFKKQLITEFWGRFINALIISAWLLVVFFLSPKNIIYTWIISVIIWLVNIIVFVVFGSMAIRKRIFVNCPNINLKLIQERYAIIYIVFLGEFLIQIIQSCAKIVKNNPTYAGIILVISIVCVFAFWWIYEDFFNVPDIIRHPKLINLYSFSMVFFLSAFIFINSGFALIILGNKNIDSLLTYNHHHHYGGYLLAIGLIIWFFFAWPIWLSFRNFNKEKKFFYNKKIRFFIMNSLIYNLSYIWVGFIFPNIFIWIVSIVFFMYVILIIIFTKYMQKIYQKNNDKILKILNAYARAENKWIKKNLLKYIDIPFHQKNNFNINNFSKYIVKI